MNDPLIFQILLQIFLILLNAVFACAEIAVISINDNKLASLISQGDKRAIKLGKLTSQPARFLATIQVAITLSGFLGSAFAADNFADRLVSWLLSVGVAVPEATLNTGAVVIITLILSYFTLVFGELVPKRIAMKNSQTLALSISGAISFISKLFAPIVFVLTASTNAILKLLRIDPNAEEDDVSEEEIRMMVDIGNQKGVIDNEEKAMIQNVFEFDNVTAEEFATHRTDVSFLWMDESQDEWEYTMNETRHSLYPICDGAIDNVIGVLNIKDYYSLKDKSRENVLENAVTAPFYVPSCVTADVLFKQMKKSRNHFSIVLDEYGGMIGIVTINDLFEQLVGDLDELNADGEIEFKQTDAKTWELNGSISLETVAEKLNISLPIDKFETFGGYVFSALGSIPKDGSQFEIDIDSLHIKVIKIKEHRIENAIVSVIEVKKPEIISKD